MISPWSLVAEILSDEKEFDRVEVAERLEIKVKPKPKDVPVSFRNPDYLEWLNNIREKVDRKILEYCGFKFGNVRQTGWMINYLAHNLTLGLVPMRIRQFGYDGLSHYAPEDIQKVLTELKIEDLVTPDEFVYSKFLSPEPTIFYFQLLKQKPADSQKYYWSNTQMGGPGF